MFQNEIDAVVREANSGLWLITSRGPKSEIAEITVEAGKVKSEVRRLQSTGYMMLEIRQIAENWNAIRHPEDGADAAWIGEMTE